MGIFDNIMKGINSLFGNAPDDNDDEVIEDVSYEPDADGLFGFSNADELRAYIKKNGWMTRMSSTVKGTTFVKYNGKSSEVVIPEGIKEIGSSAFGNNVKRIILPDTVTEIQNYAFKNCSALVEINIPQSVKTIGFSAFQGCTSLKQITIPRGIIGIGSSTFCGCTSLKSVALPDTLVNIEGSSFEGCTALETISLPDSVKKIGFCVFKGCPIRAITLPKELSTLDGCAFLDCDMLEEVSIADGNERFQVDDRYIYSNGKRTLITEYKKNSEAELIIPSGVTEIGSYAFYYNHSIERVIIGEGVEVIGSSAFKSTSLKEVQIPSSLTEIGEEAFYGSALSAIIYAGSSADWKALKKRKSWGSYTDKFKIHCTDADLSKDGKTSTAPTRSVYSQASSDSFSYAGSSRASEPVSAPTSNLPKLEYVINPGGTTCSITGRGACQSEAVITIPDSIDGYTVTAIKKGAFNDSKLVEVHIPDTVTSIVGDAFSNCSSLTSINVSLANESYQSVDGVLYSKDKKILVRYPIGRATYGFTVPAGVTCIGSYAFAFGYNVKAVTLPSTVTTISHWAFASCSFSDIFIPSGVTYIGEFAFASCKSLIQIKLPDSVDAIHKGAFAYCDILEAVKLSPEIDSIPDEMCAGCVNLKTIAIPEGVIRIGKKAFMNCRKLFSVKFEGAMDPVELIDEEAFYGCSALGRVTLYQGLEAIMDRAFAKCDSLHTIQFLSTKSEWSYVHKGADWASIQGVSCQDGLAQ